jgi:hypothetical protein
MASQVDIANRALTKLGEARIVSFTDNTNIARTVNSMWDVVRDAELRSHVWRFALARASLPALVDAPTFGYNYQYQLPSDCLRLVEVAEFRVNNLADYINRDDSIYTVEGNKILTDLGAPLNIRYIQQTLDTAQFTIDFVEVLACRLAAEMAEVLTNSMEMRKMAWQEYNQAVSLAVKTNSLELPSKSAFDDSWMIGRL